MRKADRISASTGSSGEVVAFLNPRFHVWAQHFELDDYTLVGKSEIGRATIRAFDLNHERRIRIRQAKQLFGPSGFSVAAEASAIRDISRQFIEREQQANDAAKQKLYRGQLKAVQDALEVLTDRQREL